MTFDAADMSELVDAEIDRVDLVGKAANGHKFILAKSADGNLFDADLVRELIKSGETVTEEIVKEDLDASVVLADAEVAADGDVTEPGSPAWEAVDAATAAKWTAILARAKNAVCELKEREKAEVEAGVEYDDDSVDDLKDVVSAIEYAISLLAPFAAEEAAEAATADVNAVVKAAGAIKPKQLAIVEKFAPVVKAGRTLSAANQAALENAAESIRKVLDSLPAAPESHIEGETNLGAATEAPEPAAVEKDRMDEIIEDAMAAADAPVVKADDLSTATDDELARIALTGADSERAAALQEIGLRSLTGGLGDENDQTEDVADVEDGEITEPDMESTEPAMPEEVGTSADEIVTKKNSSLKKSKKHKKAAKMVKAAQDNEERLHAVIKGLEDRIAHLEAPAASKVLTNGALPPAHLMRGQDAGASAMTDSSELRKRMADAPDAVTKSAVAEEMRVAALDALAQMGNR